MRLETIACLTLALLAGFVYFWTAQQPGGSAVVATKIPQGYYPLLTSGFQSGHLYVGITVHPALLALKDPYDPVANARFRVHDMSLYKGHYYLYYGITPLLLLFWPFAAATGYFPTEPAATALFCVGALWTGIAILLAVRRRHFPDAPTLVVVAVAACLSFATPAIMLLDSPQFYQVPISCAMFLQALMLGAVYRALHSEKRRLGWLLTAGLLFGLSLGARPNYLPSVIALLVPLFAAAWERPAPNRLRPFLRELAFTLVPVLCFGCGLLVYNWARFDSLTEFGEHLALSGGRVDTLQIFSYRNVAPNIYDYLFSQGVWQSYFPFFNGVTGRPLGVARYFPWMWLGLAAFIPWTRFGVADTRGARVFALTLVAAFLANLALLLFFVGAAPRYSVDFANAGLILAGVGALALGQGAASRRHVWTAQVIVTALAVVSLLWGAAVYFDGFPAKAKIATIARLADWPYYAWQRNHHVEFGGLRLEVRLPEKHPALAEPLFEMGPQMDRRDWLEIRYLARDRAQLSFFHAGTGWFDGSAFTIPADRRIIVETRCGSFFPPFAHPLFSGWTQQEYDDARKDLQVTVNGVEVLRAALDCYAASPANLTLGKLGWFTGGIEQAFSGEIVSASRLPLVRPPPPPPLFAKAAPVELTLYMPSGVRDGADPLFLTGKGDRSDLLYCIYDGQGRVKFALDHWGSGGPQSEAIAYDPLVAHKVTVWMDSISGATSGRLTVIFDGQTLINAEQIYYPGSPGTVILGYNEYGSTSTSKEFSGRISSFRQVGFDVLPPLVMSGSYGAVEMNVVFPEAASGRNDPLVVTGVEGAGDFIYIRYLDPTHVSVSFDHWSVGGVVGEPFELNYAETHRLTLTMGSLYPPGSPSQWSRLVRVKIDGKVALEGSSPCYPCTSGQIRVGKNPIGGSTCGPVFTGQILSVERFPQPRD